MKKNFREFVLLKLKIGFSIIQKSLSRSHLVRPAHEELHRLTKKLSIPPEKILRSERDAR